MLRLVELTHRPRSRVREKFATDFESVGLEIAPVHVRSLQTGQNRARVELFKGRTTGAVRGAVC